jgi:hypothetical protein
MVQQRELRFILGSLSSLLCDSPFNKDLSHPVITPFFYQIFLKMQQDASIRDDHDTIIISQDRYGTSMEKDGMGWNRIEEDKRNEIWLML